MGVTVTGAGYLLIILVSTYYSINIFLFFDILMDNLPTLSNIVEVKHEDCRRYPQG